MSIKSRTIMILMITSMVSVLVACMIFIGFSVRSHKKMSVKNLVSLTVMTSDNCLAALAFDVPEDANKLLAALKVSPSIRCAIIRNLDNNVFASYFRHDISSAQQEALAAHTHTPGHNFEGGHLNICLPIELNNQELGTITICDDMSDIWQRIRHDTGIMFIVMFLAMVVAYVLALKMHSLISAPIRVLSQTAAKIKTNKDYSLRARRSIGGDLGMLTDSFNEMLGEIQIRDEYLVSTQEELKTINRQLIEREEHMRSVYEAAGSVSFVTADILTETPVIKDFSPGSERIFGYKREEIIGKPIFVLMPDGAEEMMEVIRNKLLRGEQAYAGEAIQVRKSGEHFHSILVIDPLRNAEGKIIGSLGVSIDISDRKIIEQQREALINELEEKNDELERFTYTASHDLKSPLITVKGFIGQLKKHMERGQQDLIKKDMSRIDTAADKMLELLQDLLALSRIGRIGGDTEKISMKKIVTDTVQLNSTVLKGIDIVITIDNDLPDVIVDRIRITEVIQNLIENSSKFMGNQASPRIEVGSRSDGHLTVFYVSDNGIGVDPAYHQKIFGLFNQLDPSKEGTGIGLTIVKRIIEFHHGRIWIESDGEGSGSTFCFTIGEFAKEQLIQE